MTFQRHLPNDVDNNEVTKLYRLYRRGYSAGLTSLVEEEDVCVCVCMCVWYEERREGKRGGEGKKEVKKEGEEKGGGTGKGGRKVSVQFKLKLKF